MSQENASEDNPDNNAPTDLERREYFRVEDRLILRYRPVPREAVGPIPAERHFDNSEVFQLLRELRQIDHDYNNVLRGLSEQNRDLGLYLKTINRKIELIANSLTSLEGPQDQTPQAVSISESGLAFIATPALSPGTFVALELLLLPNHTGLALYGEVIAQRDVEQPARTVVAFVRLRESDRQILARHILQVQIAARRQSQANADDTELSSDI